MTKITKAVIPCGGMGTRFLPITKTLPKEMLPIIDTPVLSYIVEEAIDSGITDVLLIINRKKMDIRKYFSPDPALEEHLLKAGKTEYLERVKRIHERANISFAFQEEPKGSADAVYKAKSFTGDESFCLSWGDDLICAETPVMKQLTSVYEEGMQAIVGVQRIDSDDIVKYGVADVKHSDGRLHNLSSIVEKPKLSEIPSRLASLGRYVLSSDIYKAIENTKPGVGGELQFTDSVKSICGNGKVYAYEFEGKRYDMGDKLGAVKAITEFALKSDEFGAKYREYLIELVKSL